jgi:hypothetical protein
MRLFPSMPAAIVTGAVGMPLLIWGWKFIETTSHSQLLVLVWAIVAFIIPVVLATVDLRDVARRWRTGRMRSETSRAPGVPEDFVPVRVFQWREDADMAHWRFLGWMKQECD